MPETYLSNLLSAFSTLNISILNRVRPDSYDSFDFNEAQKVVKTNAKLIKNSDFVVAEVSFFSGTTGYDISFALEEKKPIIVLYNLVDYRGDSRSIKTLPVTLKGNTSKYIIAREYDNKTLKRTLELAIKDAKDLADTKFILIIPPEIDRYLEWNVKVKGIAKAEITRQAVEEMMKKDKEYISYLKTVSSSE
jgi:nucleoside 2-deoxyribosyltransferase